MSSKAAGLPPPGGREKSEPEQVEQGAEEFHDYEDEYMDQYRATEPLEAPPCPPGMEQYWCRIIDGKNQPDSTNISKKYRQGWRVVTEEELGNMFKMYPSVAFDGGMVTGDRTMVLMRRPKKLGDRQRAQNRKEIDAMMDSVKRNVWNVHQPGSGMGQPNIEMHTTQTFGRRVKAAPDH